ncbi:MAG TPA: hemerythrin domain-containing protein, partial [Ilumatobacteraceae bacterium]|nr:hemerythrin domain-containing protein [Ilumatobacteraceae bacterium]
MATKVAGVHGTNHPELHEVARLTSELKADLEPHLRKEETVLFPMIRRLGETAASDQPETLVFHCGSLQNPISVMLMEHDRTGELLQELRAASHDYALPGDACGSYQA